MPWVYILKGSSGRHYIGSALDLDARFAQHLRGHTATTKRLGDDLQVIAKKQVPTLGEARKIERDLKRKKNPRLAIYFLSGRAAPKAFGVGREFDSPPWHLSASAFSSCSCSS
jgi:predicted GIY-YIG superfamily endonuclease